MKKLITAVSIIVIIGTVTMLGFMTVTEMKESFQDYVNSDLVGNSSDNDYTSIKTAGNQGSNERALGSADSSDSTVRKNTSGTAGSVSGKIKIETAEDIGTVTDTAKAEEEQRNLNDTLKNNLKADTDAASSDSLAAGKPEEQQDLNESQSDNTLMAAEDTVNSFEVDENQKSPLNTTVGSAADSLTEKKAAVKEEEEEDKSKEVFAALDIVNPSIKVEAASAILMDGKGKILFHKNATKKVYPASTTKLMTALVALNYCDFSEEVTIGEEIKKIASDSSRAYLKEGEKLTFQMLLEGMLLPSGNDAAYAVAAFAGRKALNNDKADTDTAIEEFVNLMNEKTESLGLYKTQFKNPDGYDAEGQYTTAYDMGMIALEALKNDTISSIVSEDSVRNVFLSGEDVTWYNGNKLIRSGSGMYYPYAVGLKTGTSSKAGRCLVSAAKKDGKLCISVIMNSTAAGRWEDSIDLLKYGIENK